MARGELLEVCITALGAQTRTLLSARQDKVPGTVSSYYQHGHRGIRDEGSGTDEMTPQLLPAFDDVEGPFSGPFSGTENTLIQTHPQKAPLRNFATWLPALHRNAAVLSPGFKTLSDALMCSTKVQMPPHPFILPPLS